MLSGRLVSRWFGQRKSQNLHEGRDQDCSSVPCGRDAASQDRETGSEGDREERKVRVGREVRWQARHSSFFLPPGGSKEKSLFRAISRSPTGPSFWAPSRAGRRRSGASSEVTTSFGRSPHSGALGVSIGDDGDTVRIDGRGLSGLQSRTTSSIWAIRASIRLPGEALLAGRPFLSISPATIRSAAGRWDESPSPLRKMGGRIDGRSEGNLAPLVVRGRSPRHFVSLPRRIGAGEVGGPARRSHGQRARRASTEAGPFPRPIRKDADGVRAGVRREGLRSLCRGKRQVEGLLCRRPRRFLVGRLLHRRGDDPAGEAPTSRSAAWGRESDPDRAHRRPPADGGPDRA